MILYNSCWARYPTAIVDTQTTNTSWLELVRLYRAMGIKNHAFPLALINPALQGVDPHDPHLTQDQLIAIAYECKINPWYFFREVARVPAASGGKPGKLRANRGNIYLWWSFFNHVFTILIQIRQTGKSLSTDTLMVYLLHVLCLNTKINLMTKDDKLRRENIGRMKDIIECLPYYLNQTNRTDTDNGEEITVNALNNRFNTHLPQANKIRALNAGRGMTTAIMVIDEGPFQINIRTSLPAALAAMGAATEIARDNKEPYGVVMTTTAGKLNDDSGSYIYEFLDEAAVWSESYLDAENQEHLYEMIRANSKGTVPAFNGTFSHRQLGYTDDWLRERIANARAKGEDAERDFLNRWTSGTSSSPFSADVSERISKSAKDVVYTETDPKYRFMTQWYLPEAALAQWVKTKPFVIGLDTSEATGRDFIGLTYIDPATLGVMGKAMLNSVSVYNFIEYVADLLTRYPHAVLVPERRSTGTVLIDGLMQLLPQRGIDPFARIFNWIVQDQVTHGEKFDQIRRPLSSRDPEIYTRYRNLMGYATSGSGQQSRDTLFTQPLNIGTNRFAERIHDRDLIQQLLQLETRNGRVDHRTGGNDDLVIAWLLGIWFLTSGTSLHHYGINPMLVMSEPVVRVNVSAEQKRMSQNQAQIRKRIQELAQLLVQETDEMISLKYERELMVLDRQLVLEDNETFSMEELIRKASEERKRRLMSVRQQYQQNLSIANASYGARPHAINLS